MTLDVKALKTHFLNHLLTMSDWFLHDYVFVCHIRTALVHIMGFCFFTLLTHFK